MGSTLIEEFNERCSFHFSIEYSKMLFLSNFDEKNTFLLSQFHVRPFIYRSKKLKRIKFVNAEIVSFKSFLPSVWGMKFFQSICRQRNILSKFYNLESSDTNWATLSIHATSKRGAMFGCSARSRTRLTHHFRRELDSERHQASSRTTLGWKCSLYTQTAFHDSKKCTLVVVEICQMASTTWNAACWPKSFTSIITYTKPICTSITRFLICRQQFQIPSQLSVLRLQSLSL